MAVVYTHQRLDNNEVFYVGIGKTPSRAYNKSKRTKYWKNIISKTNYIVNILVNDATYDEAIQIEKYLICYYGRKDLNLGTLVNMTNGGEGTLGCKFNLGKKHSEETKEKIGEANKGKTRSEEAKEKMSNLKLGKIRSEKTKEKIALYQRNKDNIKGYYIQKNSNKFRVQINVGGKNIHIGYFNTPEEAELAYKQAKLKYHI